MGQVGRRLRDIDVRQALHAQALSVHRDDPNTLVLDELGLMNGAVRVDVAVVNGEIHGYEIKSDSDTLERLPVQAAVYNAALDRVTIVVGVPHLKAARGAVPRWWGLMVVKQLPGGEAVLRELRAAKPNPKRDPAALASLLWRDEALEILEQQGAARGLRSRPRADLYAALARTLTVEQLGDRVRHCLKRRKGWRAGSPRT